MWTTPRKASTFALLTVHPTVRVIRQRLHARARETKRAGLQGGPLSNMGLPLRCVAKSIFSRAALLRAAVSGLPKS